MVEKLDTLFKGDVVSAWHVHEGYPQPAPALCSENKQSK